MTWIGLPEEVRIGLPPHRRRSDVQPATGAPEFWVIGVCPNCGTEWAGKEGAVWPTCSCGGRIFPPRPQGFPERSDADVGGSEAVQGAVQGLVAFRMVEGQAVGVINTWTGVLAQGREQKAHHDASWPIYDSPPWSSDEAFMEWAARTFRFGPKQRPIRLDEPAVEALAALSCVDRRDDRGLPILRTPFGDLVVVDYDPALAVERLERWVS